MNLQPDLPLEELTKIHHRMAPRRSVRTFLVWLVLACLLPGILAAVVLLIHEYRERLAQLETYNIQTARALIQAVDNQILRAQALAQGLATDGSLAKGDLAHFHRRARQALEQSKLGVSVVLVDSNDQQVVNTSKEFGEPLPKAGNLKAVRRVLETGKPAVSDLFIGPVLQRPLIVVAAPVLVDGNVAYALGVVVPPEQFNGILSTQRLPPGWLSTITDSSNTIVARSRENAKYLGQKPAEAYLKRVAESNEGVLQFTMKDDVPVRCHYTRSPATGWAVVVNVPLESLHAELLQRFFMMALIVVVLFAIGLGVAWILGGKISRSVRALVSPAMALGAGQFVSLPSVDIKESAEVSRALGEAAGLLEQRTAALQQEMQLSEDVINSLPGIFYMMDNEGHFVRWNQKFSEVTGYAPGELANMHAPTLFDKATAPLVQMCMRKAFEQGESSVEAPLLTKDGRRIPYYFTGRRTNIGGHNYLVGLGIDVTESKRTEQALQESKRRLAVALEASGSVVWEMDLATRLIRGSDEFWTMLGYTPGELKTAQDWFGLVHEADRPGVLDTINSVIQGNGDSYRVELRLRGKDENWRWMLSQAAVAERNADGQVTRLVGTHTDIHERKLAEEEVERLNAELEHRVEERTAELLAANRELEGFTFAASHDLRGPLGRINSFSAMLEQQYRERLEGDGLLFLNFIRQNTIRLTHLVDDLVQHARVSQQAMGLQTLDVAAAAKAVLQQKAEDIRDAGADIQMNLPSTVVFADPHAFFQALDNLLGNALKYSAAARPPTIEIGGRPTGEHFLMWVRDNGIGFDMVYHDKIFEIFRRLHTYNEYEGNGVGLALVKRAMERMGGRVWAESAPGQGATFFLELQAVAPLQL